jgi:regulator of protease activity HflC (stomatin/prohibitin superfamily)
MLPTGGNKTKKGGKMIARFLGFVLVLVPVGIVIALFWYWLSRKRRRDQLKEEREREMKRTGTGVCSIVLLVLVTFGFSGCGVEQVDTGFRGVKTVWGEVDMKAGSLPEDLYFYNPISSRIIEMDTRIKRREFKLNTYTKDVQQANITAVANYRLEPSKAHVMYKEVGRLWEDVILVPAIEGDLKKVVGQYDAVDLIEKRSEATAKIESKIRENLKNSYILLERLELVNIQYLKEFEKSVEDKVVATQKAVEEKNRTIQVQEKAKQVLITAEANARSMQIKAQALMANAKLVEYEAIQRWDGKLPQYMFGNSTPFIDIRGMEK